MADPQKHLQSLTDEYQNLQTGMWGSRCMHELQLLIVNQQLSPELQEIIEAREKLEAQQQENKSVQKVGNATLMISPRPTRPPS
jgi:prefoldin beta subunit